MDKKENTKVQDENKYRGVNVDRADDEKVTAKMVREDTKGLNNNPRNDDM